MDCALPESLEISTVLDSTSSYREWLSENTEIVIDASQVSRVDAAGVQALCSLFISANNHQIDIQLKHPSQILLEALGTLGLSEQIKWNEDCGESKHDENSSCG